MVISFASEVNDFLLHVCVYVCVHNIVLAKIINIVLNNSGYYSEQSSHSLLHLMLMKIFDPQT